MMGNEGGVVLEESPRFYSGYIDDDSPVFPTHQTPLPPPQLSSSGCYYRDLEMTMRAPGETVLAAQPPPSQPPPPQPPPPPLLRGPHDLSLPPEEEFPKVEETRGRGRKTAAVRKYQCSLCLKQYCRRSTLKAHQRFHNGERPFGCRDCGKTFSQAANLTAHRRVHTVLAFSGRSIAGQSKSCVPQMPSSYIGVATQAANLTAHRRGHTGEKPFACPICRRPFSQSSSLVTHKRTHTGERPYTCIHCGKAFTDSSTLTKHLRTHTGVKPYECQLCSLTFSQSGNLNRHMKTHLAIQPP